MVMIALDTETLNAFRAYARGVGLSENDKSNIRDFTDELIQDVYIRERMIV